VTTSLRELEKRLAQEPDNLPLRVTVAGMLSESGRAGEAAEHYRRVAIAYRAQGRPQQAIAVCKSILELAPDDFAIQTLLGELEGKATKVEDVEVEFSDPAVALPDEPTRDPKKEDGFDDDDESQTRPPPATGSRPPASAFAKAALIPSVPSPAGTRGAMRTPPVATPSAPKIPGAPNRPSFEIDTPLPKPIPYHLADPTTSQQKLVDSVDEALETKPGNDRPRPLAPEVDTTGLAQAARRISTLIAPSSANIDVSAGLDTRQRPRVSPEQMPTEQVELDDMYTPVPDHDTDDRDHAEDDQTTPIELLGPNPIGNAFFLALPKPRRDAALARCTKREVRAGAVVIRQGETSHPLILVVTGTLELRAERANGAMVKLDTIEMGQYVGEAALLNRVPSAANVVAVVDSELLALPPHALFELAGAYPALWAALKDSAERRTRQYEKLLRG
jgi:Cyclic nucleotide-binding domain/Tetratricopeptide repeat